MKYDKEGMVVLVENEVILRMVGKQMLEKEGICVLDYSSCEEAIDGLKENVSVRGFILDADLGCGKMTGNEYQIALGKSNPEIPTVLFSGNDEKCESARNLGFKAVVKTGSVLLALKEIVE